jgi:hypothetical protein
MMNSCPNFWTLFAEALRLSAARRSGLAFIPWWLLTCCALPAVSIFFIGQSLRAQVSETNAVTIFSAVAVVSGFFGSVSVATIGQVQKMVSEYPFSSYLREEKLFDHFLFWPQFTLLIQISLILISTCGALVIRLVDLDHLNKYLIAVDVGLLVYVCTKTWNLVDLMRRLTWHFEHYNRLYNEQKRLLERTQSPHKNGQSLVDDE